ncbi:hypothetical protein J6590_072479 [Homalodisca vitripennis]|nr:hypothetical protein J6590_072479 [Homalodisca vitripennis]
MFNSQTFLAILLVASATAAPSTLLASPVAYAPGVVTASSSQVIARSVAPIVPAAPYVAAPYVASAASYFAAAPYTPYVAAPSAASYVCSTVQFCVSNISISVDYDSPGTLSVLVTLSVHHYKIAHCKSKEVFSYPMPRSPFKLFHVATDAMGKASNALKCT